MKELGAMTIEEEIEDYDKTFFNNLIGENKEVVQKLKSNQKNERKEARDHIANMKKLNNELDSIQTDLSNAENKLHGYNCRRVELMEAKESYL